MVSSTLTSVEWRNSTLITGDVVQELTKHKQRPGKNIGMTGGATLVRSLLREGLLDELGILLYPIVVGTGKRLFEDWADRLPLRLVDSKAFGNGVYRSPTNGRARRVEARRFDDHCRRERHR